MTKISGRLNDTPPLTVTNSAGTPFPRKGHLIVLEIDSSASPTHANLEGTTYSGHSAAPANRDTAPAATGRRGGDSRALPNSRARLDR